ncbi:MAG: LicD family protein [Blautia sp.]|nr:LicD family protein [Blautia sp.]
MIEVLDVAAEICYKHNIRYFADWGTLLGAVRHKGFIPWDDDMDICMFRNDYEHFLEIAPTELPEGWRVLSVRNNPFHEQMHSAVSNSVKIDYSPEHLDRFHGCPFSVGFDLYPLDAPAPSYEEEQTVQELLKLLVYTARLYEEEPLQAESFLPDIERVCNVTLNRSDHLKNQLMLLADQMAQLYNPAKENGLPDIVFHAGNLEGAHLQSAWYRDSIMLPFETSFIAVPAEYDAVLKQLYGDYMTPVQGTQSHEYPFYKKQLKILAECLADMRKNG